MALQVADAVGGLAEGFLVAGRLGDEGRFHRPLLEQAAERLEAPLVDAASGASSLADEAGQLTGPLGEAAAAATQLGDAAEKAAEQTEAMGEATAGAAEKTQGLKGGYRELEPET